MDPKTHSRSACRARTHELFIHFVDLLFSFQRPKLTQLLCFNPVSAGVVILLLRYRTVKNFLLDSLQSVSPTRRYCFISAEWLSTLSASSRQELYFRSLSARPAPRCFFLILRSWLSTFLVPHRQELFFRSLSVRPAPLVLLFDSAEPAFYFLGAAPSRNFSCLFSVRFAAGALLSGGEGAVTSTPSFAPSIG